MAQSFEKARFLTVQEVAQLMRVSSMTVYRLIRAGDLPAVRVGRSFRVRDVDVDGYLQSRYTQAGLDGPTGSASRSRARLDRSASVCPRPLRAGVAPCPSTPVSDPAFVSFLSDYGLADEFVGVCKAVVLRAAPDGPDHRRHPRHPALSTCGPGPWPWPGPSSTCLPGVVLAVVDPGVGTDRRAVAVEVETGFLVGPDNGLLAPAVAMLGGARRVVSLTNAEYQLEAPGPTFAGRDIFAPAAGYLAAGDTAGGAGRAGRPAVARPGDGAAARRTRAAGPRARCSGSTATATPSSTSTPASWPPSGLAPGGRLEIRCGQDRRTARWVSAYAEAGPMELAVVVDSYGLVSLALRPAPRGRGARPARRLGGAPLGP